MAEPVYPVLDGMPRPLLRVTPARTDTWLTCPRKYRFRYVDRPAPPAGPPWAHQSVGAAVHNALLHYYEQEPAKRDPDGLPQLVAQSWIDDGFRDEQQSHAYRDTAIDWVSRYVAGQQPDLQPLALERGVACKDERAAYSGRVDRVDLRDDRLVVVDYKTGRNPPTEADARSSAALALYLVAARQTLRRPGVRVELHHLPSNTTVAAEHTPESLSRHRDRLVDVAAEAEAATATALGEATDAVSVDPKVEAGSDSDPFPPNPGPMCGWCDYYAHCPEGRQAVPDRPLTWAGLPD